MMPFPDPAEPRFQIVFLRHGESVGNRQGIRQGQADYSLTDTGIQQAAALADRWFREQRTFDCIICSPLERARETARIIGNALHAGIELQPEWLERSLGVLTGAKAKDSPVPKPVSSSIYDPVGEIGEGQWELYLRAGAAVQAILRRPPGRYLVVTHGALLNLVHYAILGITPQGFFAGARFIIANTGFSEFVYSPNRHQWLVKVINDHSHWPGNDIIHE